MTSTAGDLFPVGVIGVLWLGVVESLNRQKVLRGWYTYSYLLFSSL